MFYVTVNLFMFVSYYLYLYYIFKNKYVMHRLLKLNYCENN